MFADAKAVLPDSPPVPGPAAGGAAPKRSAWLWRTETVLFLALFFLFMTVEPAKFFGDPGSLWHIVVGERILSGGELIRTDPFSFTRAGETWLSQAWLFDVA